MDSQRGLSGLWRVPEEAKLIDEASRPMTSVIGEEEALC